MCVVSIAGPYRKGKSYVLSEAFEQPEVFPLGHHFDPETMGIWMWVVPQKIQVRDDNVPCCIKTKSAKNTLTGPKLLLKLSEPRRSIPSKRSNIFMQHGVR